MKQISQVPWWDRVLEASGQRRGAGLSRAGSQKRNMDLHAELALDLDNEEDDEPEGRRSSIFDLGDEEVSTCPSSEHMSLSSICSYALFALLFHAVT